MRPMNNCNYNSFIDKEGNESSGLTLFENRKKARKAIDRYLGKLTVIEASSLDDCECKWISVNNEICISIDTTQVCGCGHATKAVIQKAYNAISFVCKEYNQDSYVNTRFGRYDVRELVSWLEDILEEWPSEIPTLTLMLISSSKKNDLLN